MIRSLFERAISLSLPPKKMKVLHRDSYHLSPENLYLVYLVTEDSFYPFCAWIFQFLFKKFLEYEKTAGDDERVEYVKQRAMEYADSTLA